MVVPTINRDTGREASLEEDIKNMLACLLMRTTHRRCFSNINAHTNDPQVLLKCRF